MRILVVFLCLLLAGCSYLQRHGVISTPKASVAGFADAGKAATLATSDKHESLPIPANSTVIVSETAAQPASATEKAVPARKVTEIKLGGPTEWQKFDTTVAADTGTVDTSVAVKKIDIAASLPLLYAAIAAGIAACVFVYLHYPTPAMAAGGASAVFFLAWKVSNLPSWFWGIGLLGLGVAVAVYFAHERGLNTPVPTPPKTPP